MPQSKKTDKPK